MMINIKTKQFRKTQPDIFWGMSFIICFMIFSDLAAASWVVGSGGNNWSGNVTLEDVFENVAENIELEAENADMPTNHPAFSTVAQSSEISLNDGFRKWVFREDSDFWNPREFYCNNVGGGTIDLVSENPYAGNSLWGKGTANVPGGTNVLSLVENSESRVKVEITNSNGHTLLVTIYPTGKYYASYNIVGTLGPEWGGFGTYYGDRLPQLCDGSAWNNTTKTWVVSDIDGNEYAGIIWCPYTTSMAMANQFDDICWGIDHLVNRSATATLSGSGQILIDASNYRATTALRDAISADYRNPANIINGDLTVLSGSCVGDGYDENVGAYAFNANNNQVQFNLSGLNYTKYDPVFEIHNYTASILPVILRYDTLLTRGIHYNIDFKNKSESTDTIIIQYLNNITTNPEFNIFTKYKSSGNLYSVTKDAESVGSTNDVWKQISATANIPINTDIDIYVSTSQDNGIYDSWTSWILVKDNAVSEMIYDLPSANQERYAKFRINLNTVNSAISPEIESVTMLTASVTMLTPTVNRSNDCFRIYNSIIRASLGGKARMEFNLSSGQEVRIKIFDITGRLVYSHVQYYSSGLHEFYWDGENCGSGTYLVYFETMKHRARGKIILVR